MLLTEQEIDEIHSFPWERTVDFVRRIESAVLEKLKAQKPVAWRYRFGDVWMFDTYRLNGCDADEAVPVFKNPLPPADVVRDAERLDWLMNSGRIVICDRDGCYTYTHTSGRYGPVAKTQREAIDAAMKDMK